MQSTGTNPKPFSFVRGPTPNSLVLSCKSGTVMLFFLFYCFYLFPISFTQFFSSTSMTKKSVIHTSDCASTLCTLDDQTPQYSSYRAPQYHPALGLTHSKYGFGLREICGLEEKHDIIHWGIFFIYKG